MSENFCNPSLSYFFFTRKRRINLGQKEIGAGGDIVAADEANETRIQKKIRQLEEDEKLRYYHVDEYKVNLTLHLIRIYFYFRLAQSFGIFRDLHELKR